jgi:GT2 family glycosyltransferase
MTSTPTDRPYRLHAMIPMRDKHGLTRNVCRELAVDREDFDELWLYDNGSTNRAARDWLNTVAETGRYRAEVIRWGPAHGIYAMWNHAIQRAAFDALCGAVVGDERPVYLAILNNDLILPPGFLKTLGDALFAAEPDVWVTYPDWQRGWPAPIDFAAIERRELRRTRGTRNLGGMSGYAFLLDVETFVEYVPELIDERYLWHSGDGDLVTKIQREGGTAAAVVGLPIGHLENATSTDTDWTTRQGKADRRLFRELNHGE